MPESYHDQLVDHFRRVKSLEKESAKLQRVSVRVAALRAQRDDLIRAHPGSLREIGQAAGLSHQQIANIKARKEEK